MIECLWCNGEIDLDDIRDALEEAGDDEVVMTCPYCNFELFVVWEDGEKLPCLCKQ